MMKIREIEFDEKQLIGFETEKSHYVSVTDKICVKWTVALSLEVTDDFELKYIIEKIIEYTERDFDDSDDLNNYIFRLENKLDYIISKNGK